MKIRSRRALTIVIVIVVVILGLDRISRYTRNSFREMEEEAERIEEEREAALRPGPVDYSAIDWLSVYEGEGVSVTAVDADALFNDHEDYVGRYVYTVFTIKDTEPDMLKAATESNHSIYFSIVCLFDDPAEIEPYAKGDVVAVVGMVLDDNFTVTLTDSHVIAAGEEAGALQSEGLF